VPLQAYHFFIDRFVDAIRYEIARSSERAYQSLSLKDMAKIFMISNQDELKLFIEQNSNKDQVAWTINEGEKRVYFVAEKNEKNEIPSVKMINTTLEIATELNRII
jgi:predicted GNAT family acetyltransferase